VFNPRRVIMLPSPFERQVHGADQGEAIACCRCFQAFLYLLSGMCSSERPGAVQGALKGAAKRPLDGEDRSERIEEEGKERRGLDSISEAQQAKRMRMATMVLSETRGL
jgi:hypothetical protein